MAAQLNAQVLAFRDKNRKARDPDWSAAWRDHWRHAVTEAAREARSRAAEARNAATAARNGGTVPGHPAPATISPANGPAAERDRAFTRSLTSIYGSEYEQTRHYRPSSPEAQAYIERAERAGEPDADVARYRRNGVRLRPSEARRIVAGGAVGSQPVGGMIGTVLARAANPRASVAEAAP